MIPHPGGGRRATSRLRKVSLPIAIALTAAATVAPATASSEAVALIAKVRSATVRGTLISYKAGIYLIATNLGQIMLRSEVFECKGDACPTATELAIDGMQVGLMLN